MDRILIPIGMVMLAIALFAIAATAGGDYDREPNCWTAFAAKNRVVFANTCNPDASFAVKVKDLQG